MTLILKQAKQDLHDIFGKDSCCYAMAQENISGYFRHINNFSSTLCVASTGDHVLNCVAHGARHITVFDKNPIAIYMTKIKLAAVNLQRDEFLNFFLEGPEFFKHDTYLKFVDYLDIDAREFWDEFYTLCHEENVTPEQSKFFMANAYDYDAIVESNYYLSDKVYYDMRWCVNHCEYVYELGCLSDVTDHLSKDIRFNTAILSNASEHLDGLFPTEKKWRYIQALDKFVDSILENVMAFDGEVCYAYIYRALTGPMWSEIDDIEQLPNKLTEFSYWTIPSIRRNIEDNMSEIDMILYRKRTLMSPAYKERILK